MRLRIIACNVFYREVCALIAESPHTCDVEFLPRGLHDLGSEKMASTMQRCVSETKADQSYDAICLAYGLCNNGIVGLWNDSTKIVVPRAHDCIALFMGSHERYQTYFDEHPGTWYRTTGWYERFDPTVAGESTVQQKMGMVWERQKLVDKYGEDNADYILETMGDPTAHYNQLTFISMGLKCEAPFIERARLEAAEKEWTFDLLDGSMAVLGKLINGNWDDNFLLVEPGQTIQPSHDPSIIKSLPCTDCALACGQ